jgi:o-succinylbenzoate synthase
MQIESMEVVPYALPFAEPYVTARGRLERRELLLVRLHAGGLVGLGEAAPLALRGGNTLAEIAADLDRCRHVLVGARVEHDPGAQAEEMVGHGASAQARLAVELACLDLLTKARGLPLHELFGERGQPVRCNATLVAGAADQVAAKAREWAGRGFDTFKLKCGVDGDVEQVRAVRDAVPEGARIRVDANGTWSVDEAAARLDAMGPLELAEQPVATLAHMRALRERTKTKLAADESVVTVADARAAAAVCDAATVKLAKVGSVRTAFAIASELPVYLSSALDGPVGIAAAAHVALALPGDFAHGLATSVLFADTIASRECHVDGGELHLTGGPGLGVEIDDDALDRHRIDLG